MNSVENDDGRIVISRRRFFAVARLGLTHPAIFIRASTEERGSLLPFMRQLKPLVSDAGCESSQRSYNSVTASSHPRASRQSCS